MNENNNDLKLYKCTKTVKARPMDYHTAGKSGLIRDYSKENPNQEGYYVVYEDGYESWSPREAFENGYSEISKKAKTLSNTDANGTTKM